MPVINKIDLPSAQPDVVMDELENILAIPREEVLLASAKEGIGITEILEAIVARVPPPKGNPRGHLRGLVFDSHYDQYKGVVTYVRLAEGTLHGHSRIRMMGSGAETEILELGVFRPQLVPVRELAAGEVGYIATGLKSVRDAQVGDTVTDAASPATEPPPGYLPAKSLVFAGIYPISGETTRSSATRWRSSTSTMQASRSRPKARSRSASGSGAASSACCTWRCPGAPGAGVLVELIASAPSVEYRVTR